jgi:hypothetical protein
LRKGKFVREKIKKKRGRAKVRWVMRLSKTLLSLRVVGGGVINDYC